jgi:hypothetical protein
LGAITWVALGSSGLIVLLVVLLVTLVDHQPGGPIDFDRVTGRMGADCFGQLLGPLRSRTRLQVPLSASCQQET